MTLAGKTLLLAALVVVALPARATAQGAGAAALDNDYVRVTRDAAPCAVAAAGRCEDRVILAMGDIALKSGDAVKQMKRGQVAVFKAGESYEPPASGFFEIAIKPNHPAVKAPAELIPAPMNVPVFQGAKFFIYEERLNVGDTRPRHSHAQRVEIRLNNGPMLRQQVWRADGVAETVPHIVNWREPVIHVVTNIGDMPLHNFILEFIPQQRETTR